MLPPSQGCAFPLQPASTPSGLLGWIPSLPDPNWTNCYFRPILFLPKPGIILPLISRPCSAGFPAQAFWLAAFKQLPRFSDSPSPALKMAVDTSSSKAPGPGSALPRHPGAPGLGVGMAPCSGAAADIPTPQPEQCKLPARTLQAAALPAPRSHRLPRGSVLVQPLLGCWGWSPSSRCHEARACCPEHDLSGDTADLSDKYGLSGTQGFSDCAGLGKLLDSQHWSSQDMWRGPTGIQQLCHPLGFPWSLKTDLVMGVQLTLGMGGQPIPPTATTLVTGVGSSTEPLPTDNPCSPKPPRPLLPPALHLLSHRAPSRQAQLQGQSAWSICSGTVSGPPARPQHGRTACCHPAGTAAMEIGEWERSWCCRGQGEGKCRGKGTAGGQCANPSPARCPQKSPASPDLERSRK